MNATQIARYLANELSEDEAQALLRWIEESPENKRLFIQMKNAWSIADMGQLKASDLAQTRQRWQHVRQQLGQETIRPLKTNPWRWAQLAAAVLLVSLAVLYLNRGSKPPIAYRTIEIPAGKRSRVLLPDRSVVWLNARSKLRYPEPFNAQRRDVYLDGEGFFDVTPSTKAPFLVHTDRATVRVMGTAFNVQAYPLEHEQRVVLVHGQVAVSHAGHTAASILKPGFLATIRGAHDPIVVKAVDTAEYTAWTSGKFHFSQLTFSELARRLERKFNIRILFQNQNLLRQTFSGTFEENEPLGQILQVIQASSNFDYSIRKDTVLIR